MGQDTPDFIAHQDTPDFIPHQDDGASGAAPVAGALPEGSFQTRPGGPIQNSNDSSTQSFARSFLGGFGVKPTGNPDVSVGDESKSVLGQLGTGVKNFAKGSWDELSKSMGEDKAKPGLGTPFTDLLIGPHMAARGIEGAASALEGAGSDVARGVRKNDPNAVATGAGSTAAALGQLLTGDDHLANKVGSAAKSIERAHAINTGQVQIVNHMVKTPLAMLDGAVSKEIENHVNAVVQADEASNHSLQNAQGMVKTTDAAKAARDVVTKITGDDQGIHSPLIQRAEIGSMTMRAAKDLSSVVGKQAAMLERSGKGAEAAPLHALYKGLHEATQKRANDLGADYGKSWKHYITEASTQKRMEGGLMGELMDEKVHSKALNNLVTAATDKIKGRAAEVGEIKSRMKQYGVDPASFQHAIEVGKNLTDLSAEVKNAFIGKMRAIIAHPVAAGSAAAGAAVVGHASGVPGAGFVLPLIVAGKVAGMLDASEIGGLLKDIQKYVPQGAEKVYPGGEGPMSLPRPLQPNVSTLESPDPGTAPAPQPGGSPVPAPQGGGATAQPPSPYSGAERRSQPAGGFSGPERRGFSPGQSLLEQEYQRRLNDPKTPEADKATLRSMLESSRTKEGEPEGQTMAQQIRSARAGSTGEKPLDKIARFETEGKAGKAAAIEQLKKIRDAGVPESDEADEALARVELAGKLKGARRRK